MLNNKKLSLETSTSSENTLVFIGTAGNHDITVQYPLDDNHLVKVSVDDSYIGAYELCDIDEDTDINEATENFLWSTNALHDG